MKKIITPFLCLLFLGVISACESPFLGWGVTITYSNLATPESLNFTTSTLENVGVPLENIQIFRKQVELTNNFLKELPELQGDFLSKDGAVVKYDEELAFNLFIKLNPPLPDDVNCRIAAWNLVKDRIQTIPLDGDIEYMEQSILDYYPYTGFSTGDKERFWSVYKGIQAGFINTTNAYASIIKDGWTERGVSFTVSDVSLVSCFAYASDNKWLEAVHAGVMINTEDAIVFIEKYNPKAPFQVSKFNSEDELRHYLKQRLLSYFILQPIIMKNDILL